MSTAAEIRAERDKLLLESDHMALADRITEEWRMYRHLLRIIPEQQDFPSEVRWPTEPE
jgi:ubiquinone biosynthesis protein UbiJ